MTPDVYVQLHTGRAPARLSRRRKKKGLKTENIAKRALEVSWVGYVEIRAASTSR